MKIGKATVPRTSICTSDAHTIVVRGKDLSKDLIGKVSFVEHFFLLLTGQMPTAGQAAVLNATLVAIAEHGLVPSVQAARMTFAAAPDAMQGAVAAGILGCGSVVLGSSETAGRMYSEIDALVSSGTAICTSDPHTIVVRGRDLSKELIGKVTFVEHFFLLLNGRMPSAGEAAVLNATLVAIAEHGLVPSVQAARMTFAAAPDAMQGAVAAGILGCGSVVLGSSETAGRMYAEIDAQVQRGVALHDAALAVMQAWRAAGQSIPGYGHPLHKERDERVDALFGVARAAGTDLRFVAIAEAAEAQLPTVLNKPLKLNVSGAIPAVLLGAGFPVQALKGVPILARTAGLIAHLFEEISQPIGFALSYQATREMVYDGELPAGFGAAE